MAPRRSSKAPTKKASTKAAPKKAAMKRPLAKKAAAKKAPAKRAAAPKAAKAPAPKAGAVKFGRPGTAGKAEGEGAVRAWIDAVKPEHRPMVEKLDALVRAEVPDVKSALKWSMPMYGREGLGYFASVAAFKNDVALSFFSGAGLTPPLPAGEGKEMRRVKFRHLGELDEKVIRSWISQASKRKGWGTA